MCNIVDAKHHIVYTARCNIVCSQNNLVLCPLIDNDVLASLEMMLTLGQTMLCPYGHKHKKKDTMKIVSFFLVHLTGRILPLAICTARRPNAFAFGTRLRTTLLKNSTLYCFS